ncbi:MAG: hypothetical protein H7Y60_09765 [Rhodospirillaceae bacterium]|nr:hypothetical protein [Rhodospirillales bacterium]
MSVQQKCISPQEREANVREIFPTALAAFVGSGKRFKDTAALSLESGKSVATLQRYLRRQTIPDLAGGLVLMNVLGPEFAAPLLLAADLAGAFVVEGNSPPGETLREVIEGAAALAAAWTDLRIDHTEWPRVRQELTQAMVCIAQFLATGGAR